MYVEKSKEKEARDSEEEEEENKDMDIQQFASLMFNTSYKKIFLRGVLSIVCDIFDKVRYQSVSDSSCSSYTRPT